MIYGIVKGLTAYSLLENGVSNTLALQDVRHGTNFYNYLKISVQGAHPKFSGTGADHIMSHDPPPQSLFVSKDMCSMFEDGEWEKDPLAKHLGLHLNIWQWTRIYTALSTVAFVNRYCGDNKVLQKGGNVPPYFWISGMLGLIAPSMKFHYTDKEMNEALSKQVFIEDPYHLVSMGPTGPGERRCASTALITQTPIPPSRIGIPGALCVGLNKDLPERIKAHPYKFLYGILSLVGFGLIARSHFLVRGCNINPSSTTQKAGHCFKRFLKGACFFLVYQGIQ